MSQKITSRQSLKDVRHLEIDLTDSGLRYQPGDALGVWYENDPALVAELLALLWLKGDEPVQVAGQALPLAEALQQHYELTQNTLAIVAGYAAFARDEALLAVVADKAQLQQFALATPIVDMVRRAPIELRAEQLLSLLRPLRPHLMAERVPAAPADIWLTGWGKTMRCGCLSSITIISACRAIPIRRSS